MAEGIRHQFLEQKGRQDIASKSQRICGLPNTAVWPGVAQGNLRDLDSAERHYTAAERDRGIGSKTDFTPAWYRVTPCDAQCHLGMQRWVAAGDVRNYF